MSSFLLYILGICQSISALPKLIKISLVFEKGLDPKNPLLADNGLFSFFHHPNEYEVLSHCGFDLHFLNG